LVRPWTKKLHLHPLPYPLLPIRLVVVAGTREHESRKLVLEEVVAFSRLLPFEHQHRLERDAVVPGAIVLAPEAIAAAVVPEAIVLAPEQ